MDRLAASPPLYTLLPQNAHMHRTTSTALLCSDLGRAAWHNRPSLHTPSLAGTTRKHCAASYRRQHQPRALICPQSTVNCCSTDDPGAAEHRNYDHASMKCPPRANQTSRFQDPRDRTSATALPTTHSPHAPHPSSLTLNSQATVNTSISEKRPMCFRRA